MIDHHPELDLLLDYSSGALPEPMALPIACHASTCRQCHDQLQKLDELGGALLEESSGQEIGVKDLEAMLARLDESEVASDKRLQITLNDQTKKIIPKPLRNYLNGNLSDLDWRKIGSKVAQFNLNIPVQGCKVSLMQFKAGAPMPIHTHKGNEVTLVLSGGYSDDGQHFERGDFDARNETHTHQPVVDEGEDCIALVVMDAPVVLAGPISRFLNPFFKL